MADVTDEVLAQLGSMYTELLRRRKKSKTLNAYYTGTCKVPDAVERARMRRAYQTLMGMSAAPWGSLVVDSVMDRLEVSGLPTDDKRVSEALWRIWQNNQMDAESKLGHLSALIDGRAFATVWPGDDGPEITLDAADQMIVMYAEGSRSRRVAALRCWVDDSDREYATVYRRDGIYKFQRSKEQQAGPLRYRAGDVYWEIRQEPNGEWPVPNVFNVVPNVEIAINRRLRPGAFPYARGEFEHVLGLLDRINLLTFLGLVVAVWQGFPLRVVIGHILDYEDILDSAGAPVLEADGVTVAQRAKAPFDAHADTLAVLESPDAKLDQFSAADRRNLAVFAELDQLAVVTHTPRHYFPLEQGMHSISADAIRASEGGMHAKVTGHKASLGEGWEEVLRLAGRMSDDPIILPPGAKIKWKDHESRSMAERADAAVKVASLGLPWQFVAERWLNMTPDEIARVEADVAAGQLDELVRGVTLDRPMPTPVLNGDGAG